MTYSAKDRALAIRICQVCALSPSLHGMYATAAGALGIEADPDAHEHPAERLAFEAWSAVEKWVESNEGEDGTYTEAMLDGEAAALLAEGWSPGEPVVRLGGASC